MNKAFIFLFTLFFFFSCSSSQKNFQKGNYNRAFRQTFKKVKKGSATSSEKQIMTESLRKILGENRSEMLLQEELKSEKGWKRALLKIEDSKEKVAKIEPYVSYDFSKIKSTEIIQVTESAVNDIILIGLAMFFLVSLETRIKSAKAITALNELRAIAHIVDMHQLTKDPTEIGEKVNRTASSPHRALTAFELIRYLDYCSEMLSIVGKIAALYAQEHPQTIVISTVNEIESLTSGISRKAWQKIMIVQQSNDSLKRIGQ